MDQGGNEQSEARVYRQSKQVVVSNQNSEKFSQSAEGRRKAVDIHVAIWPGSRYIKLLLAYVFLLLLLTLIASNLCTKYASTGENKVLLEGVGKWVKSNP